MSQSRDADEIQNTAQTRQTGRRSGSGWLDVWFTLVMITGAVLAIAYFISDLPAEMRPALLLGGTAAGVLGWGVGIILSPYGGREQLSSRGTGRLLTGLIAGFLTAWFWHPIKELLSVCGPKASDFFASGLFPVAVVSFIIFLLAMITTYVFRGFNGVSNG